MPNKQRKALDRFGHGRSEAINAITVQLGTSDVDHCSCSIRVAKGERVVGHCFPHSGAKRTHVQCVPTRLFELLPLQKVKPFGGQVTWASTISTCVHMYEPRNIKSIKINMLGNLSPCVGQQSSWAGCPLFYLCVPVVGDHVSRRVW